jgi:hypothetical protein
MNTDRMVKALEGLTPSQARLIWEAVSDLVVNLEADVEELAIETRDDVVLAKLFDAREIVDRLDMAMASVA